VKKLIGILARFSGGRFADAVSKNTGVALEMVQDDNYTKRARPSIIYIGLAIIAFNYCVVPVIQQLINVAVQPYPLPSEFWLAWGGAVSAYNVGRSMEKSGKHNVFTQAVTGEKTKPKTD